MALLAKVVQSNLSTTTTATVDIVAPGLGTPKAAILWSAGTTVKDTSQDHARMSFGFTDGTNQFTTSYFDQDNAGTTVSQSRASINSVIMHIDGTSVVGEASFDSWITDGIRLVMDTGFAAAYFVTAILFSDDAAGNVIDNVFVGTSSVPAGINNTNDITEPGFQPDVIITVHGPATIYDIHEDNAQIGVGCAARNGTDFDQGAVSWFSQHGLDTSATAGQVDTAGSSNNFLRNSFSSRGELRVVSADSSGFTAQQTNTDLANSFDFGYICMSGSAFANRYGAGHALGNSTGDFTKTGTGFQPGCVLQIQGVQNAGSADSTSPLGFSVGAFDESDQYVDNIISRDNTGTSDTHSKSKDQAILNHNDINTISHEATFTSFNADGWVYNYTTAASNNQGASIAFDSQEPVAPSADTDSVTVSTPAGSRDTRLEIATPDAGVTKTQWEITPTNESKFTITTTASGTESANVSSSDLNTLNIWLPPSHDYTLRTRHYSTSGGWGSWSASSAFTSRGPLNSYDKYLALSGISGVDNVDA